MATSNKLLVVKSEQRISGTEELRMKDNLNTQLICYFVSNQQLTCHSKIKQHQLFDDSAHGVYFCRSAVDTISVDICISKMLNK